MIPNAIVANAGPLIALEGIGQSALLAINIGQR